MVCVQDVYCIPKSVEQSSAWINRVLKIYFNCYNIAYSVLYKCLKLPCITDWVGWKIGISFFLSYLIYTLKVWFSTSVAVSWPFTYHSTLNVFFP